MFSVVMVASEINGSADVIGLQFIPRNMHMVFALLCFVVVIHWLIFPYPSGLLHWNCGNLTIAPVPAKQPWLIWINTSCEFIMNDCITTTKQSTPKPCAYFLGYTVVVINAFIDSSTGMVEMLQAPQKDCYLISRRFLFVPLFLSVFSMPRTFHTNCKTLRQ